MEYLISDNELSELIESVSIVKSFDPDGINISLTYSNPKEEITKCVNKIKSKGPVKVIGRGEYMGKKVAAYIEVSK